MTPVSTGPSSRIMVRRDKLAGDGGGAEGRERGRRLQRQHAAGEESGEHHDGERAEADDVGLNEEVRPVDGRAEEIHEGAKGEQGVILHGEHKLLRGSVNGLNAMQSACTEAARAQARRRYGQDSSCTRRHRGMPVVGWSGGRDRQEEMQAML